MGTINTSEVAKKNPSVYIEMVQQKADLDLAALENSRQLSLLYLETYARENNLRLEGYSTDNENILSKFDTTYNDSKLIKGMKTTSKGFSTYSKVLNDEEIDSMINNTDKLINEGIDKILEGDFTINPKVIDGTNVSCSFCEYKDICYLREKDITYINREEDKDGEDV